MASDNTELRGIVSADLAQALDAIAMAKGMHRHAFVVSILEAEVKRYLREASVVHRVLRGNPLLQDADGGRTE
jgi:predicted transcriptional regulator